MTPLETQQAADQVSDLYNDLEDEILGNIVRHCQNYDQPIPSDEWQLQKLAEMGRLNQENLKTIAKASGKNYQAMLEMLQECAGKAIAEIVPGFEHMAAAGLIDGATDIARCKFFQDALTGLKKQAKDVLNLTNTAMLYKASDAYRKLILTTAEQESEVEAAAHEMLNKGVSSVVSGVSSRAQALRKTVKQLNDSGIAGYVDKRGRNWTPEAYVSMCMRATAKEVSTQAMFAGCETNNVDLLEVDSHAGARPKCAMDQGKVFSRSGKDKNYPPLASSSYGQPDGLFGINCGHHGYPFVPGINIRRYFPTEDLEENNRLYQQTQVQRGLERDVRHQKRLCMEYDALGDKEAFEEAAVKLKTKEAKLKDYVNGNSDLHRRKDREQVVGFDKRVSARAVAENNAYQKKLAEKEIYDKMESEIKSAGIKGKINFKPEKIDVSQISFDDKHINAERAHKVTREEALQFIHEADISVTKWNGRFINYYGPNGAAFVDTENNNIRTAFHKEEFDEHTRKMREVLENHGKN